MRQHRTFLVLAVFVSVLGMTSCGGSKPATSPDNSPNATAHTAQPVRATPSASAKMICAPETQAELAVVLGVHPTQPVVPAWTDHTYSCKYTYHNDVIAVSVKEFSNQAETDGYFTSLAHRLGQTQQLHTLGQGAFTTNEPLGRCPQGLQGPSGQHLRTARPVWRAALQPGRHRAQRRWNDHELLDRRLITQTGDAPSTRIHLASAGNAITAAAAKLNPPEPPCAGCTRDP